MLVALIGLIGLIAVSQILLIGYLTIRTQRLSGIEAWRLSSLATEAMNALLAKSLAEKAEIEMAKQTRDAQVAYLADQLAKSPAAKAKMHPQTHPIIAKTEDGQEIDMREYEVLG